MRFSARNCCKALANLENAFLRDSPFVQQSVLGAGIWFVIGRRAFGVGL